ncbi:Glucose-6-phosphate isomerase [Bremerella volcania]|uniref:Glucose-6-phosphate isomerase n=1 Tax=Bremerella volcania TaxID=2527984 RepID=A0A518C5S1_9BACT|nr:Glucose-6-phosphate isomerase [Bremerella volcania]
MSKLTESPVWQALSQHHGEIGDLHMRDLFAQDADRFDRFSLRLGDILFDFSKNRITEKSLALLVDLAHQAGLAESIRAMFAGEKINTTEQRAALHVALRNRSNRPIRVDGQDVMPEVHRVLEKMRGFGQSIAQSKDHHCLNKQRNGDPENREWILDNSLTLERKQQNKRRKSA